MASALDPSSQPVGISHQEKLKRLSAMSENEFRDRIVRPLFSRLGYADGRDLHGASEQGKDMFFLDEDKFGEKRVICVQTKKGKLSMSSGEPRNNIQTAIVQLRMALTTPLPRVEDKQEHYPYEVFLCASGKINDSAQRHIASELKREGQIKFLDGHSIADQIDRNCPQLWDGISIDIFAYYDSIRRHVEHSGAEINAPGAANDSAFVQLTFFREKVKKVKRHGQMRDEFEFEELRIPELTSRFREPILIVGDAGSGKSTALWRVAYEVIRRDEGSGKRIPIIVSARDLDPDVSAVEHFVSELKRFSREFCSVPENLFRDEDIESGRIMLLVDGLDELADSNRREDLCDLLSDFRRLYPRCGLIATTRPDTSTEEYFGARGARVYEIAPISWRQVKKVIRQVLDNKPLTSSQTERITSGAQEVLRRIEEVHGFQITPLLATVYAASAEYSSSDIPANITELFKKYSELMLGRWDEQKGLQQQFHAPLKDFLLQKIAYDMHTERALYVGRERFGTMIHELLKDRGHDLETQAIEYELLHRSRLLRAKGTKVGFSHLLLQEFFAGRAIPDNDVVGHIDDAWWTKPIVFYYGERPGEIRHLRSVQKEVMRRKVQSPVSYRAQGLALQASYLSVVDEKIDVWLNVVRRLGEFMVDCISEGEQGKLFPITENTFHYLGLRDAVALSSLGEERIRKIAMERVRSEGEAIGHDVLEAMKFWVVVALLESGLVREARDALREYRFDDFRYYFWIRMGALFIEKIVPVSQEKKTEARKIREEHDKVVRHITEEFFKEHKTLLLEKRIGKVVEVSE